MSKKPEPLSPDQTAKLVFGMLRGKVKAFDFELLRISMLRLLLTEGYDKVRPRDWFFGSFNILSAGKLSTLSISKNKNDARINLHLTKPSGEMRSALVYGDSGKVTLRVSTGLLIEKEGSPNKCAKKFLRKISSLLSLYGDFGAVAEYDDEDCCRHKRPRVEEFEHEPEMLEHTVAVATKRV